MAPAYCYFMEQLESVLGLSLNSFSGREAEFSSAGSSGSRESQENPLLPEISVISSPNGENSIRLSITPVPLNSTALPQYFCYERTKDLVLWHIKAT